MVTKWDTRPQEKRDTPLYLQCRDSDFHPHFGFETHNTRAFGPQPLILERTTLGPSALYLWFWNTQHSGFRPSASALDFGTYTLRPSALYLWFWNTQHSVLRPSASAFDFGTHYTQAFGPLPLILKHTTLGPSALCLWFWNALHSDLRPSTFDFETHNTRAFGPLPLILKHTTLGPSALCLCLWFWNTLRSGFRPSTFDFGIYYTRAFGPLPLILTGCAFRHHGSHSVALFNSRVAPMMPKGLFRTLAAGIMVCHVFFQTCVSLCDHFLVDLEPDFGPAIWPISEEGTLL